MNTNCVSPAEPSDLEKLCARFEIAVSNFGRSCLAMKGNEKAFQAWFAACLIQEFGLSRVYREIHLDKKELKSLAPFESFPEGLVPEALKRGNELFPDISVSWRPDIDARHTHTRRVDAGKMLLQLGILAEFKVTGSTGNPTGRPAVAQDLAKLAIFQTAQQQAAKTHSAPGNPPSPGLQTFMVILDNFSTGDKYTLKYTRKYDQGPLGKFLGFVRWPEGVQRPVVLSIVADKRDRARIDTYRDFKLDERDAPESAG